MKKWISTIVLILLAVYIVVAAVAFSDKPSDQVCGGIRLNIVDSTAVAYMTTQDVQVLLADFTPTGKPIDEVSCRAIEKKLDASPLIRKSQCYKTIDGYVAITVECRRPVLRVIADGGENFYLDEEGAVIERISKAVYLPVATGCITREFAKKELLPLAQYLHSDDLWNAQIEQIHVTANEEIQLVPRVGDHVIVLGRPGDYAKKFDKLQTFYKKALVEVGWDRYSHINVDYSNQVVATKKSQIK